MKAPDHVGALYIYGCGSHPGGMRWMADDHPEKLWSIRQREVYPVTEIGRWVRDADAARMVASARKGVAHDIRQKIAKMLLAYPKKDYSLMPLRELDAYLSGYTDNEDLPGYGYGYGADAAREAKP